MLKNNKVLAIPKVSIIIPVYNQLEYTKMCLESIWHYTSENYEVIVVNNGSQDATKEYLKQNPQIYSIHNGKNLGFAKAINQGISAAGGNHIIILNNDCIVSHEWVQRLLRAAEEPKVGIVGVMSNFAASPQLIKVNVKNIQDIPRIAQQVKNKYNNSICYTTRVVGLCMLIKRELIEKIGGFDPRFGLGTFEDDDFSLRSILCGYKNVIAKDVFIFHFGSVTFKKEKIPRNLLLRENWQMFKEKWGLPVELPLGEKDYLTKIAAKDFDKKELYIPYKVSGKEG
ncbi:MAG: glycosyltransferase family 2 protein [Bacillota bacterium]